jgi:hypothetical protein
MPVDPLRSKGAKLEREAVHDYLRRQARIFRGTELEAPFLNTLDWIDERRKRYDKHAGVSRKK